MIKHSSYKNLMIKIYHINLLFIHYPSVGKTVRQKECDLKFCRELSIFLFTLNCLLMAVEKQFLSLEWIATEIKMKEILVKISNNHYKIICFNLNILIKNEVLFYLWIINFQSARCSVIIAIQWMSWVRWWFTCPGKYL